MTNPAGLTKEELTIVDNLVAREIARLTAQASGNSALWPLGQTRQDLDGYVAQLKPIHAKLSARIGRKP